MRICFFFGSERSDKLMVLSKTLLLQRGSHQHRSAKQGTWPIRVDSKTNKSNFPQIKKCSPKTLLTTSRDFLHTSNTFRLFVSAEEILCNPRLDSIVSPPKKQTLRPVKGAQPLFESKSCHQRNVPTSHPWAMGSPPPFGDVFWNIQNSLDSNTCFWVSTGKKTIHFQW